MRKLFEVYSMDDNPIEGELEDNIAKKVHEKCMQADLVVVNDFGHGLLTDRLIKIITENSKFLAVNAQTNSANFGFNF